MKVQRRIRDTWLILIKHTLNHLTRAIARGPIGPFSIIHHTGRRSGKPYATPVIAQPVDNGFVLALTYGPDVDWYKNVRAAGSCRVSRHGKTFAIDQVAPLATKTGLAYFPLPQRAILRALDIEYFVKLRAQEGP